MEKLFGNPGNRLKQVAFGYFILAVIACVILAFVLGFRETYYWYDSKTELVPELFFSLLFGGPIAAYFTALPLYAIGDHIENTMHIRNSVKAIEQTSKATVEQAKAEPVADELPEL